MKVIINRIKRLFGYFNTHPLIFCVASSFFLELTIESLAHFSIIEGFKLLIFSPIIFAINMLIITVTLSLCLLVKRSIAMYTTVFCVWLGFGIANCVILMNRPSPFTISDLTILPSVISIITVYLEVWQIILIAVSIILALIGIVIFWIKAPKRERSIKKDAPNYGIVVSILAILLPISMIFGTVPKNYSEIYHSYYQYGFPYSFVRSAFVGISMPNDYSKKNVDSIVKTINTKRAAESGDASLSGVQPNIIYVQLESFIDVKSINNVRFSIDPVPNFTALKEQYPSGYLTVPLIGSGTANTEFEVLTGMNTDHFAPGEYPYLSSLTDKTCESAAFLLREQGYHTFALHNHTGTFYSRNTVYPNLGFSTFVPVEYMYGIERNELGWAKDKVLADEIVKCTDSTEWRDFIFTVSVQPHGKYETEAEFFGDITVYGIEDEELAKEYSYYANQIYETDAFVGDLISRYENSQEPTVIVFYGDHLPDLGLTESDSANLYRTEYVIWNNFGLETDSMRRDLQSYQLSSYVFDQLGMNNGIMFGVHKYLSNSEDYEKIMLLMEYDALFGDRFSYDGLIYHPTDMHYGTKAVRLDGFSVKSEMITVYGSGFNESSVIYINGEPLETVFVNQGMMIADIELDPDEPFIEISVGQTASDGTVFTYTPSKYYSIR